MTLTQRRSGPTAAGRRRGPVRLLVVLVVVLGCLVVLDRVAAWAAGRALASNVQSSQQLSVRPKVTIRGFPFIAQVLRGNYGEVDLASRAPVGHAGVEVASAKVHLHGVRVNLSDALHGTVRNIPVASGTGSAMVTYPELDAILHQFGGPLGSTLTVTGTVPGSARLHGPLGLSLDFSASVVDGKINVTPDPAELARLPGPVGTLITNTLAAPIELPNIPFNVTLASGHLEPGGLFMYAESHNSVFPVR